VGGNKYRNREYKAYVITMAQTTRHGTALQAQTQNAARISHPNKDLNVNESMAQRIVIMGRTKQ
jgi:hypothetical protein